LGYFLATQNQIVLKYNFVNISCLELFSRQCRDEGGSCLRVSGYARVSRKAEASGVLEIKKHRIASGGNLAGERGFFRLPGTDQGDDRAAPERRLQLV